MQDAVALGIMNCERLMTASAIHCPSYRPSHSVVQLPLRNSVASLLQVPPCTESASTTTRDTACICATATIGSKMPYTIAQTWLPCWD